MIGGLISLLLGPAIQTQPWGLPSLLVLVIVFFPWAGLLINNVAAGTKYRGFGSTGVLALGVQPALRGLLSWLVLAVVVLAVFGHLLEWPAWWAGLYRLGYLAGPAMALFLFHAALGYQTSLWLIERGAAKRCSNDHEFSPFEPSCPMCSARKELELVLSPARV